MRLAIMAGVLVLAGCAGVEVEEDVPAVDDYVCVTTSYDLTECSLRELAEG